MPKIPPIDVALFSRDELIQGLYPFYLVVDDLLAIPVFARTHSAFDPNKPPQTNEDNRLHTLWRAVVVQTFLSLRKIEDFLTGEPDRDDKISRHWGYSNAKEFLTDAEREDINKRLAHLTWRQDKVHAGWPGREMVGRAIREIEGFLEYLVASWFIDSDTEHVRITKGLLGAFREHRRVGNFT